MIDNDDDEINFIHEPFIQLSQEIRELGLTNIQRIPAPPAPLEFYRDYVSANRPVIIEGAVNHWPAIDLWPNNSYLLSRLGDNLISVAVTPDGLADSINSTSGRFVLPCQEKWKFSDFLNKLINDSKINSSKQPLTSLALTSGIVYAQQQNSSFHQEFSILNSDISLFDWANEAFGSEPEAVNLWIGSSLSATSPHLDHYENLYTVITGEKIFLLWPPSDAHWMNQHMVKQAIWKRKDMDDNNGGFELANDDNSEEIPWSNIDIKNEWKLNQCEEDEAEIDNFNNNEVTGKSSIDNEEKNNHLLSLVIDPQLRHQHAPPICVRLRAGETLYLPSLWYHGVLQGEDATGKTIAINQWYDMEFDSKYAYHQFVNKQSQQAHQKLTMVKQKSQPVSEN